MDSRPTWSGFGETWQSWKTVGFSGASDLNPSLSTFPSCETSERLLKPLKLWFLHQLNISKELQTLKVAIRIRHDLPKGPSKCTLLNNWYLLLSNNCHFWITLTSALISLVSFLFHTLKIFFLCYFIKDLKLKWPQYIICNETLWFFLSYTIVHQEMGQYSLTWLCCPILQVPLPIYLRESFLGQSGPWIFWCRIRTTGDEDGKVPVNYPECYLLYIYIKNFFVVLLIVSYIYKSCFLNKIVRVSWIQWL